MSTFLVSVDLSFRLAHGLTGRLRLTQIGPARMAARGCALRATSQICTFRSSWGVRRYLSSGALNIPRYNVTVEVGGLRNPISSAEIREERLDLPREAKSIALIADTGCLQGMEEILGSMICLCTSEYVCRHSDLR